MHLTWQAGDPVVQLNFPNPLNVSVQVGDVAYFSNPTPVGQAQPWTATTTPHLSNPQSGIIMIGEIIQIIPWNGTVSSIICNMPQILYVLQLVLLLALVLAVILTQVIIHLLPCHKIIILAPCLVTFPQVSSSLIILLYQWGRILLEDLTATWYTK